MKVVDLKVIAVPAGWRTWQFLRIETSEGIVGWSDCTDAHGSQAGLEATIGELSDHLVGRDPLPIDLIFEDLYRITRQSCGGIIQKAIAAIENALLDIKAKFLGISVASLLGGPVRSKIPLYWSHCGSTRVRHPDLCDVAPLRSLHDVPIFCQEVLERGYRAIKTNMLLLSDQPCVISQGFKGAEGSYDRNIDIKTIKQVAELIGAFRNGLGSDCEIILDINMHLRADGVLRLAEALGPYDLAWLEVDLDDPVQLQHVRQKVSMPVGSCEKRQLMSGYLPFLEKHALDIAIADVRWTGVLQAKRIADLAKVYDINVAPHNHGSPLASLMAAQFCASVTNLRLMEYDVDDVPWRDGLLAQSPEIVDGYLHLPEGPGWGIEIDETRLMELSK